MILNKISAIFCALKIYFLEFVHQDRAGFKQGSWATWAFVGRRYVFTLAGFDTIVAYETNTAS